MSRRLDDWIDTYMEFTDNTEPRELFRKWSAVSTIASCLQRKCFLSWGELTIYPNLYVVLVGPPAARKGTAMESARQFMDAMGIEQAANASTRQALIEHLVSTARRETDATGRISLHCSLTAFNQELTVFLRHEDKDFLGILCDWFDCMKSFRYQTKARGFETVHNVWFNIFGATTPSNLIDALPRAAEGSGFISRTIFVFEEDKAKIVIYPGLTDEQRALREEMLIDLEGIKAIEGGFRFTEGFYDLYKDWRYEQEEIRPFMNDPMLCHYADRRQIHILKLAMIFCASRADDMLVEAKDFEKSKELLHSTEAKMSMTFRGVGANPLAETITRVEHLLKYKKAITMGELMRIFFSEVTKEQMAQVVAVLEQMGIARMNSTRGTLEIVEEKANGTGSET